MAKKVLFLIESLAGGGAEKVLITLLNHMNRQAFDVTLCCVSNVGVFLDELDPSVDRRSILPEPSKLSGMSFLLYKLKYKLVYSWLPIRWVYRLFVPKGYDVEVAFVEGFATKLIAASSSKVSKKIAWVHIDLEHLPWTQDNGIFRSLEEEKACYSRFDRIICVSQAVADAFKRIYEPKTTVSVLHNPIDSRHIVFRAKEDCPIPSKSRIRIVSMGRLVPQKAFDRLLRVASHLKKDGFSFELWILGDGRDRRSLDDLIDKEHLRENVLLWGFKQNPYPYIASADLFVCSSLAEGFSTAIIEALVLGVPVVATDCAGVRELLEGSGCGIISSNDDESLYFALKQVLGNSQTMLSLKQSVHIMKIAFPLEPAVASIESLLAKC